MCVCVSLCQHVCVDCKKNYCSRCSAQQEPRPRLCHTCQRFYGNLLERAELMKLKVKELRDYLHLHEVATNLCREKVRLFSSLLNLTYTPEVPPPPNQYNQFPVLQEELVELILGHQSSSSSGTTPDTPTPEPLSLTSDLPDLRPHITPDPTTATPILHPDPPPAQPEATPPQTESVLSEPDLQDEDQVNVDQDFTVGDHRNQVLYSSKRQKRWLSHSVTHEKFQVSRPGFLIDLY